MPNSQGLGPAIPRRRLGAELRRLRRERAKNLAQVAEDLLISTSKLSRLEKGNSPAQERDIRDLLTYYDQAGTELGERMRRWAAEGREEPWWQQRSGDVPPLIDQYLQYETAAKKIDGFAAHYVPTLLQTADYARTLLSETYLSEAHPDNPDDIEDLVGVVRHRQEILTRDEYPASLDVVIDETPLRRVVGSRQIMLDQLEQLVEISSRPNVTLRALPFSAGLHRAVAQGTFTYFTFRRDIDSDIVNIEGYVTDTYVEGEQVEPYRTLLDELRSRALGPIETRRFISQIIDDHRKEV